MRISNIVLYQPLPCSRGQLYRGYEHPDAVAFRKPVSQMSRFDLEDTCKAMLGTGVVLSDPWFFQSVVSWQAIICVRRLIERMVRECTPKEPDPAWSQMLGKYLDPSSVAEDMTELLGSALLGRTEAETEVLTVLSDLASLTCMPTAYGLIASHSNVADMWSDSRFQNIVSKAVSGAAR